MRLSVDSADRGYTRPVPGIVIHFDGAPLKNVITADEEEGYVLRYKPDQDGRPMLNAARTDAVTEELRGTVRIVMPERNG